MPNQPLEPNEIELCKGWLGYPQVQIQANPIIGTSRVFEDVLQKYAGDQLIGWIRNTFIVAMQTLETEIQATRTRFKVDQAGKYKQNPAEFRMYRQLWKRWLGEFSKKTGIKCYDGPDRRDSAEVF